MRSFISFVWLYAFHFIFLPVEEGHAKVPREREEKKYLLRKSYWVMAFKYSFWEPPELTQTWAITFVLVSSPLWLIWVVPYSFYPVLMSLVPSAMFSLPFPAESAGKILIK